MKRKLILTVVLLAVLGGAAGQAAQATRNWDYLVRNCEAIGVRDPWYANTGNGFYFGPQFTRSTWHANGGGPVKEMDGYGPSMHAYSISYIIGVAERTYRSQGPYAWPWCHSHGYI